jgi:hypothetical protein
MEYSVVDTKRFAIINFCSRNAAIMWLKRYGTEFHVYRLHKQNVMVINHHVYFYDFKCGLGANADFKRIGYHELA